VSYDIQLTENGIPVEITNHSEGGTYPIGGTTDANLNITYNYSWFYYMLLDKDFGIRWIYGKRAQDCIKRLEGAVKKLGVRQYKDYWAPTPGNAGYALSILLTWAKQYPEAIFTGD
jgi:hypothetical protein